jgi:hypothetical protein
MGYVVSFLRETFCEARETEFTDAAQCGAFLVFWALGEDIEETRDKLIAKP